MSYFISILRNTIKHGEYHFHLYIRWQGFHLETNTA